MSGLRMDYHFSKGFSASELMVTVGLMGILTGLATPSYQDVIEKRRITNGAEQIAAFVSTVQSESVKRNELATVSYVGQEDGSWCIGAVLGQTPCNCLESDPANAGFCSIDSTDWVLRDSDIQAKNLISSMSGDGSYAFDPVRGVFVDPSDSLVLGLDSGEGQFRMNLSVIATGKVAVCLATPSDHIPGFDDCPQQL